MYNLHMLEKKIYWKLENKTHKTCFGCNVQIKTLFWHICPSEVNIYFKLYSYLVNYFLNKENIFLANITEV
jgi:hypothetical protein